jgi:predicted nuclease with TOPRIM domain
MSDSDEGLVEELQEQLEKWNMGLEELQATVERAEAERKTELRERLEALRADFERAKVQFDELSREGGGKWDEFRSGMEEGRRLLDEALEEAGSDSSS